MVTWLGWPHVKDFQAILSLTMSLLILIPFKSLLVTSLYVFLCHPLSKVLLILEVLILCHQCAQSANDPKITHVFT